MPVKSKITIQFADVNKNPKTRVVDAEVDGSLAVNKGVNSAGRTIRSWTVSHVPTGWAIIHSLTLREARAAMRELGALKWPRSTRPSVTKNRKDLRDAAVALKARIVAARGV